MAEIDPGPEAMGFDPPAPLFAVDEDNVVILEPLHELSMGLRVAIPNPWAETENYAIGVVRGPPGKHMLELGKSLGKLVQTDSGWVCVGLARMDAIAQGLARDAAAESRSFTQRLLKRTGKRR